MSRLISQDDEDDDEEDEDELDELEEEDELLEELELDDDDELDELELELELDELDELELELELEEESSHLLQLLILYFIPIPHWFEHVLHGPHSFHPGTQGALVVVVVVCHQTRGVGSGVLESSLVGAIVTSLVGTGVGSIVFVTIMVGERDGFHVPGVPVTLRVGLGVN